MGHSTAIIKLELSELPSSPSTDAIMNAAVRKWHEDEADRYADARQTYPGLSPMATERVAEFIIDEADDPSRSKIIPITTDYAEKTSTVRLEVTGAELMALRQGSYWELRRAGRLGDAVVSVEIAQLPKARAPRAEATEGKVTTSYRVVNANRYPVPGLQPSYPTQAAARAAAVQYMGDNPSVSELAVEATIQRDTGKVALVSITRPEPEKATATFKVTTQKPTAKAKITGYLVSFDFHH